jgi:hydrogen peroxide-dependent heme synthase
MSSSTTLHPVPLTIEGAWLLHQIFTFTPEWYRISHPERRILLGEVADTLRSWDAAEEGQSRMYSVVGHKGDLMFVHRRDEPQQTHLAELELSRLSIAKFWKQTHSYFSVVELGLYESSVKTFRALREKGIEPHTPEWDAAIAETLQRQKEAMGVRLRPELPPRRCICFYPMDRLRGETRNWYSAPIEDRQRMMHEHGLVGRRYADEVKQIISGSTGLDDWEWGVDLFADDPAVFKRIIYEMRFDEASAVYGKFGAFFIGFHVPPDQTMDLLLG